AKKKKKEEAANAKLLEAEKRIKERERRRQHMMLMKAMEARKKAEALPELPRIPGLVLSGSTFSDCLMIVQFLRNFGKVLGFDVNTDVPSLSTLQEGLLNIGDSRGEVQDLLVKLVSAAVCDPGLVTGYKAKTILGEHLLNVGINRDNVSEILQMFMEAHCGQTELTESLKTKAFQAHTPAQKAAMLAFLVNELACSKSVVSEIDKNIDYMSNLRRDKWMVEGKLRKSYDECLKSKSEGEFLFHDLMSVTGLEEIAKEKEKLKKVENIHIKEEVFEISEEKISCLNTTRCEQKEDLKEKDNTNLFLQKPGSFSKLSKLLEVAKMPPESDVMPQKPNGSAANGCTPSYQNTSQNSLCGLQPSVSQSSSEKSDSSNLFSPTAGGTGKFYSSPLIPSDQLLKTLTEKNRQWFSLLPRVPCDDMSITHVDTPATATSLTPQSHPPSKSPSPVPSPLLGSTSAQSPMGLSPFALPPLQMKPGLPVMGLQFCGWPTGVLTSNVQFSSPLPTLGSGLGLSEGNGNSFLTSSVPTSKSESPALQTEKVASATCAAVEVAKPVDHPNPKPIPEVAIIDINENEDNQVTRDVVENWSVEEQAMEVDLAILQQVEDLERRVASASLQVKGWLCPEPASEREDLVYHEHKSIIRLHKKHDGDSAGGGEGSTSSLERKSDNPLDIAVTRLADLERNIERRYLKSPLSTTIQIKLDNVGTVTVPAPAPSISGDGDGTEEDIAPGLRVWRKALSEARSAAQVALCIQQLQKSIAWEKSIMKVYCQICRKGDNEELLLLCDGCDKGCHTYCHRPKITTIPDGDWFCPACIAKASGQTLKLKKLQIKGKKSNEQKRGRKLPGDTEDEDSATTSTSLKRGKTDPKKRKMDESVSVSQGKQENFTAIKKPRRDDSKDLAICSMILSELETHEDAWPFLLPVNLKLVPGYKKVIKKPMDFSTIRDKLTSGQYPNVEAFSLDVRLVFDNCETFNEDDSDIGRAGHNMRKYFEKKWTEIFKLS
ncbi:hypothetical protein CIB84_002682, partial [Bambusicola thoracicus]